MPLDPLSERAFEFQCNFIKSGEGGVVLDMLTKNKFLPNADDTTKRSAYLTVLKFCKFLLTVIGNIMVYVMDNIDDDNHRNNQVSINVLKQALQSIPNQNTEYMLRAVATKLTQQLAGSTIMSLREESESDKSRQLFVQALLWDLPSIDTIRAIIRLAWAASIGNFSNTNASPEALHAMHEMSQRDQRDSDNTDILGN